MPIDFIRVGDKDLLTVQQYVEHSSDWLSN